ncbi:MAG: hypothetical protein M5U28_16380 [Sandaracinaceae bacterium]|nr:hypothetical protein [Sandaracinaceae bacterium]
MRAWLVLLLALCVAGPALAQPRHRRVAPPAVRRALVGCWTPWPGERWVIEERERILFVRITYTDEVRSTFGVRGTLRSSSAQLSWDAEREEAHFSCGPTTQHGQSCAVRLEAGEPVVRLARFGHRRGVARVSEHRPARCGDAPRR